MTRRELLLFPLAVAGVTLGHKKKPRNTLKASVEFDLEVLKRHGPALAMEALDMEMRWLHQDFKTALAKRGLVA